eukprot:403367709
MGVLFLEYSEGVDHVYVCKNCNTHLTTPHEIVSRVSIINSQSSLNTKQDEEDDVAINSISLSFHFLSTSYLRDVRQLTNFYIQTFHGKTGKAYLFDKVMNVQMGPSEDKQLATGMHQVRDVYCVSCLQVIGWTYVRAYVDSEKYKEGKTVIEKFYIKKKFENVVPPLKEQKEQKLLQDFNEAIYQQNLGVLNNGESSFSTSEGSFIVNQQNSSQQATNNNDNSLIDGGNRMTVRSHRSQNHFNSQAPFTH